MNYFIYTTPHPAHKALADSMKCVGIQSSRKGLAKIPSIGRYIAALNVVKKIPDNVDYVLTESISTDLLAGATYKAHRNKQCKLIALLTDPKLLELKTAPLFDQFLTMWSLKWADQLFVGSKMMYDLVPAQFKHKTNLFYPGIENINQYLKVSAKHGPNCAFVGRLDDYKGTDILPGLFIRAGLSHLYIAGDGPNKDLFKQPGYNPIVYLGKTKNSLFMHQVASMYISTARYEPSGVAVIEAMAQGLVPIVSQGVGYKDIVEQVSPRLVCSNLEETKIMMNTLANNKKLWNIYSKAAKKEVTKYSYKYMIKDFKSKLI